MDVDLKRETKMAASEAFAWTAWTEVAAVVLLLLMRPLIAPYLFHVDFTRECLTMLALCGIPIFACYWMDGMQRSLRQLP